MPQVGICSCCGSQKILIFFGVCSSCRQEIVDGNRNGQEVLRKDCRLSAGKKMMCLYLGNFERQLDPNKPPECIEHLRDLHQKACLEVAKTTKRIIDACNKNRKRKPSTDIKYGE